MLRKTLFTDSHSDARCAVSGIDMKSKGLYFPLYFKSNSTNVMDIQAERSDADYISQSGHSDLGETDCSNLQVDALISPALWTESRHSSYLNCDFDGSIGAYQSARQASFTSLSTYGHCEYSSLKDIAYVTPQSDFGWHSSVKTPYKGYTYEDQSTVRHEFVPFGKHFALIITKYSASTYLPAYPQFSYAICTVTVKYAQFNPLGITVLSNGPTQVLSASGSSSAFRALMAFAADRTSDPTGSAAAFLAGITPHDESTPSEDYSDIVMYDPRAYSTFYQAAAKARLSNVGILCAADSLNNEIPYADWADLADTAIDNCHYTDTNSIAYLRDFSQTFGEVKDAYSLIRNPLNLKSWANLWLGVRFGTRLAAADTKAIIDGTQRAYQQETKIWNKKFSYVRSRSSKSLSPSLPGATWSRTCNYKVYYKPNNDIFAKSAKLVTDMGLFPTTKNLWDLIPFSFVVDWFVGVSDVLTEIDRRAYEQYLTILGCTYSYKDEYNVPVTLTDLGFENTTCVVRLYVRQHRPSIHQSYLRLTSGHLSHVNVIDGLTLLIQKFAK